MTSESDEHMADRNKLTSTLKAAIESAVYVSDILVQVSSRASQLDASSDDVLQVVDDSSSLASVLDALDERHPRYACFLWTAARNLVRDVIGHVTLCDLEAGPVNATEDSVLTGGGQGRRTATELELFYGHGAHLEYANWLETVATRYTQSPNHDLCCRLLSHIPLLAAYTGWPAEKHLRCNPAAKTWPFQTKTCSKLVGAEETAGDFSWTPSEEDKQFIEKTVTSLVRREDLCRLLVVAMAIELERLTSCAERGETGHQLDANGANWPPKHNDKWSVDSSALDLTVDGDTAEVGHSGNRDFRKSQRTSPEMFEVFGSEQVAGNVQLLGDGDDSCDGGRRSLLPLGAEMPQQDVRGGESGDGAHSETHTVFKDGSTLVPDSLDNTSSTSFPATLSAEAPLPDIEANIFEGEAPDWFSQESCKEVQIKSLYAELAEAENADVPPSAQCFAQCCASRGRRPEAKHNNASSEWQNLEARSFDSRRSIADTPPAHPCLDLTPLKTKAHPLAKCAENDCKTTSMITPAEFRADYHAAGENKAEEHNRFEHRTVFGTHGESLGTRTGTPAKHEGSTTERDVHDDCRVMFRPRRSALPVPVRTYNSISRAPTSASPVSVAGSSRTHADVTQSAVGRDRNQRPTATDVKRAVRRKTVAV